MIYGHGDDLHNYSGRISANFSSNVWHEGTDERLEKILEESISSIRNYPAPNADTFRNQLALFHGLPPEYFIPTNGAIEAFYLIAQAFRQTSATIFFPTFAEYEDAARLNNIACEFIPLSELSENIVIKTVLAFICNPNNPTGELMAQEVLIELIKRNQHTVFVIDEAYADMVLTPQKLDSYIDQLPNMIIVHSLTKTFGIPGLRAGYVMGAPELMHKILLYKIPWSVNSMALRASEFIMKNYHALKPSVTAHIKESFSLRNEINASEEFQVIRSDTPFFLVKMKSGNSGKLKLFLIQEFGCLIRDASDFRGLNSQYFRVSAQRREENELLLRGLHAWTTSIHLLSQ